MLFAAMHESAAGTSETSSGDPAMSAKEGQSGRAAEIVKGPSLTLSRHEAGPVPVP
jgi:hypothetical protein